jgi:hypothetical protein
VTAATEEELCVVVDRVTFFKTGLGVDDIVCLFEVCGYFFGTVTVVDSSAGIGSSSN